MYGLKIVSRVLSRAVLAMGLVLAAVQISHAQPELDRNVPDRVYQMLSNFVERTYLSGYIHRQDLYHVYYARRLKRYWSWRNVSRRKVVADKRRHFRRWPRTSYRLIDDTLEIYRIVDEPNAYAIRFDYDFDAVGRGKRSSGKGNTQLLIRIVRGTPIIYREVGSVLERY